MPTCPVHAKNDSSLFVGWCHMTAWYMLSSWGPKGQDYQEACWSLCSASLEKSEGADRLAVHPPKVGVWRSGWFTGSESCTGTGEIEGRGGSQKGIDSSCRCISRTIGSDCHWSWKWWAGRKWCHGTCCLAMSNDIHVSFFLQFCMSCLIGGAGWLGRKDWLPHLKYKDSGIPIWERFNKPIRFWYGMISWITIFWGLNCELHLALK